MEQIIDRVEKMENYFDIVPVYKSNMYVQYISHCYSNTFLTVVFGNSVNLATRLTIETREFSVQ